MTYAERFVIAARAELGTRYHHQGRVSGLGMDCLGLLVVAAKQIGVTFADASGYPRMPTGKSLMDVIKSNADVVEGPMLAGDILVFSWSTEPQHVAIYLGEGRMIHSYLSARKVVEHDFEASWAEKLRGVYRPRWPAEAA